MFDQASVQTFIDNIRPAVEATASALATTADNLWSVGIMKQYVDGIYGAFVAVVCLIMLGFCWKAGKSLHTWIQKDDGYSPREMAYSLALIPIVLICFFFYNLYDALLHLIVPQYTLVMEIMQNIN